MKITRLQRPVLVNDIFKYPSYNVWSILPGATGKACDLDAVDGIASCRRRLVPNFVAHVLPGKFVHFYLSAHRVSQVRWTCVCVYVLKLFNVFMLEFIDSTSWGWLDNFLHVKRDLDGYGYITITNNECTICYNRQQLQICFVIWHGRVFFIYNKFIDE